MQDGERSAESFPGLGIGARPHPFGTNPRAQRRRPHPHVSPPSFSPARALPRFRGGSLVVGVISIGLHFLGTVVNDLVEMRPFLDPSSATMNDENSVGFRLSAYVYVTKFGAPCPLSISSIFTFLYSKLFTCSLVSHHHHYFSTNAQRYEKIWITLPSRHVFLARFELLRRPMEMRRCLGRLGLDGHDVARTLVTSEEFFSFFRKLSSLIPLPRVSCNRLGTTALPEPQASNRYTRSGGV